MIHLITSGQKPAGFSKTKQNNTNAKQDWQKGLQFALWYSNTKGTEDFNTGSSVWNHLTNPLNKTHWPEETGFLAALLLSKMMQKYKNRDRGWVETAVLKSYKELIKRTMRLRNLRSTVSATIAGAQPWDFKSKVTTPLPGQRATCRISILPTTAPRRMLPTAPRRGKGTKAQCMGAVSPGH